MTAEATPNGEYVQVGWSIHPTPDLRCFMSPHDKNSLHMDGCIPLYARRSDLEARGMVVDEVGDIAREGRSDG